MSSPSTPKDTRPVTRRSSLQQSLSRLLRGDKFQRDIVRLGGGTALGQFFVVASTPLFTRLYSPQDFALTGLVIGFVGLAGVAAGLRYDIAVVDAKTDGESHILFLAAAVSALPISLLAGVLYLFMIHHRLFTYQELPPWSVVLVIAIIFLTSLLMSCRLWYARFGNFKVISRALVLQGAGRAVLPLLLSPFHLEWVGLISGEVAGRCLGLSRMLRETTTALRAQVAKTSGAEMWAVIKRYWRYPAIMMPSSLIDSLQTFLPLPLVNSLFGAVAAGEFVLILRVSGLPMSLVAASVSDVYHSRVANTYRTNPAAVENVFKEVAGYLARISLLVYIPVTLLSPFVFGLFFGAKWHNAGILNAIMAPSLAIQLVSSPLTRTLNVLGHQSWKIMFDIPRVLVPIGAMWFARQAGADLAHSLASFAAGSAVVEVIMLAIIWYATRRIKI
jgi:lipopolysaccharide exporter